MSRYIDADELKNAFTNWREAEKMPPFCPNCGASMVNEDE